VEGGFDYDAVVSAWKDRGWLLIDVSDRAGRHHQVAIAGHKPRVIAIKRDALRDVGCVTEDDAGSGEYLLHLARSFVDAAARREPLPNEFVKLQNATRAVHEWASSVRL
jgi:hypothetical protein